jgi:protein-S-isoprenylcysteine O-methyltransferase Ste14
MGRFIAFLYGVASYLVFLVAFLYAIGFVGNLVVPKSIDTGTPGPFGEALLINALLLGVFAVQHSVMARPGFKKWWTQFVPRSVERSTYVLLASLALLLLYWQWRPMTDIVWHVENELARTVLWALFASGWVIVLLTTFMINHFDLFGLRQVYLNLRQTPYTEVRFQLNFLYRLVRHPLMLGFLIAFWSAPTMSVGRLVFALATTGYIFIALQFEERDLLRAHGSEYAKYQKSVSMILPIPK